MSVTATMVKTLRERTGAGMMECKKFLIASNGDIEKAILEMRKAGQAKADKKADRIAAEGSIVIAQAADGKSAVIIEVNSETDFVARDETFKEFINDVAETALVNRIDDIAVLSSSTMKDDSKTVEQARQALVAHVGENVKLRRMMFIESTDMVGVYLHGSRIGVVVAMRGGDDQLAKDMGMQIAASRPIVVSPNEVPESALAAEREIFSSQALKSGKPQEIVDKMVEGRMNKFIEEVSLLGQPFVKDPSCKVSDYLKQKGAEVLSFVRYEVGEGIEKKVENFAEEVMAQVKG